MSVARLTVHMIFIIILVPTILVKKCIIMNIKKGNNPKYITNIQKTIKVKEYFVSREHITVVNDGITNSTCFRREKKSRFEFTVKVHGTKIKATLEAMVFLFIHKF